MKSWLRPTRTEWITFIALIPIIDTIVLYIMFGDRLLAEGQIWLYAFPIGYAVGLVTFYLNVIVMHRFQQLMPDLSQTPKRVALVVVSHLLITSLAIGIVFWSYNSLALFHYH